MIVLVNRREGALANTNQYNWYFNNPDGETYEMVVARVSSWLDSIKNFPRVIAISHGLSGRILPGVYTLCEVPYERLLSSV